MRERLNDLWLRIRTLLHRRQLEQDLEDELAFHLAMKQEKLRGEGASGEDAQFTAQRRLGNATVQKERLRDRWTFTALESLLQDARHACRSLMQAPLFTTVAVLSLAIGIGANTAIFTAFNALFLRSLPVRDPQNLRAIYVTGEGGDLRQSMSGSNNTYHGVNISSSYSYEAFQLMQKNAGGLSSMGGFAPFSANVVARSQAYVTRSQLVSGRYFETLGAEAALGRTLLASDDSLAAPPAAVISWRLFERLFGGDTNALGASIFVGKVAYTVVGVLPPAVQGLSFGSQVDLYVPLARAEQLSDWYHINRTDIWWIQVIGRLAPGATDSQVTASLTVLLKQLADSHTEGKRGNLRPFLLDCQRGLGNLDSQTHEFLMVLLGMVGLVLLIACVNVANLLLARAGARARELAIRCSLGAGRLRLIRYLLTEALLLAALGAAAGFVLAQLGTRFLERTMSPDQEQALVLRPDWTVLAFTCGLSLLTALLFGLVPAVRASRAEPALCLKQSGAGSGSMRQYLARVLVTVQITIAVVLVAGAGLFARTMINLGRVPLGFNPNGMLLFQIEPERSGYQDQRLASLYRRMQQKLTAIPGVRGVTMIQSPLLSGWMSNTEIRIPGGPQKRHWLMLPYVQTVGERYFSLMGTPVLLGRDFQASDNETGPKVVIINQKMAQEHFGGSNPIGREFYTSRDEFKEPLRVVGVVADAAYDHLRDEKPQTIYFPWPQHLKEAGLMHFELRTAVPPASVIPAVRRSVASLDPTLPISDVKTQDEIIHYATARERTYATLSLFFSLVALGLACIGVYGLLAYSVTRRTAEFGIRIALGATRGQIRWLVLRGTLLLIGCAIVIGTPAALAAARLIRNQLFGIEPNDAATLAISAGAIVLSAVVAAWLPSTRAAKADPSITLRYE